MGKEKFESRISQPPREEILCWYEVDEDLIKYGVEEDVWFHVDKLSSAHVYVRMREGESWDSLPEELLIDCAQLTKANSIEGISDPSFWTEPILNNGNRQ